jgi:diamine N-acetyltransferase
MNAYNKRSYSFSCGRVAIIGVKPVYRIEVEYRMTIRPIEPSEGVAECAAVIRASFSTVAGQFGLTKENAPSHPSFLTAEALSLQREKGASLFGLYDGEAQLGCVAIEPSKTAERTFYLERLAVLPECRHRGYGRSLLDFAAAEIGKRGGKVTGIAIIDEHAELKRWYQGYGFVEIRTQRFPHLPFP